VRAEPRPPLSQSSWLVGEAGEPALALHSLVTQRRLLVLAALEVEVKTRLL
jgi:hypothetical protein